MAASSSKPAVDPTGVYLIKSGSGSMGSALVTWQLHEQRMPQQQVLLSRHRKTPAAPAGEGVRSIVDYLRLSLVTR